MVYLDTVHFDGQWDGMEITMNSRRGTELFSRIFSYNPDSAEGSQTFAINVDKVQDVATFSLTALIHFAQSSKMGTATNGFDAILVDRPFLVSDFRAR